MGKICTACPLNGDKMSGENSRTNSALTTSHGRGEYFVSSNRYMEATWLAGSDTTTLRDERLCAAIHGSSSSSFHRRTFRGGTCSPIEFVLAAFSMPQRSDYVVGMSFATNVLLILACGWTILKSRLTIAHSTLEQPNTLQESLMYSNWILPTLDSGY